jgi:hypothetical protein
VAQFRDANCLICAFAAMESAEIFADDGFTGERDVIGGGDKVEIDAAYYHNGLAHIFRAPPITEQAEKQILVCVPRPPGSGGNPSPGLKLRRRPQDDDARRIVRKSAGLRSG